MGQLLVGDEEEGDRGAGRQEEDEGDDDLLGERGAGIVAVLRLSSGLQKKLGISISITSLISAVLFLERRLIHTISAF